MRMKVLLSALLVSAALPATADEGMWTFDNFPSAAVKAKYGVDIDRKWLDHVQASAVRLAGGCSASVVSADGMVLTNHHCVAGCVQDLSTPQKDFIKDGFFTANREDEKQCPGMQAEILATIGDVTATINAATKGKEGQDYVRARDGAVATIERDACAGKADTNRCQVISLYDGGQYKLYTYRKYSDVRLVFAVEFQTAFFGGDPDNFNFPRYDLDFSFLRLYENGRPVPTPEHLRWAISAPKAGDPVFVAGNPGGTDRLLTADQLTTLRDLYPMTLMLGSELRGRYTRFGEESPEHARIVNRSLFGTENGLKAGRGQFQALQQASLIESKRKADADLKAKVDADPMLKASIGDPWAEIAKAQIDRVALYKPYYMLEARAGYGAALYRYGRTLVRAAQERGKANAERLREYAEARLPLVQKGLLDVQPVEREVDQLQLEFWLTKLREELTADAPETALFLGKDSPENLARELATTSRLDDPELRKELWDGGMAAINASNDPMIKFVLKTDAAARAIRKQVEERVDGPTARASERIAQARFAVYGTSVYPDATFSLRLSYGKIAGWTYQSQVVPPFTYYEGLYQRATGKFPFDLASRWVSAEDKLDGKTVFDVSSDNDIIGGNSGSPLINANGDVIGAIFDGNIHSLGGDFFFDPTVNRAVSVSTAAITEALKKIYGQDRLVAELTAH